MRHAVFFDRDGVVNVFPGPGKFVLCWEMFNFMPGVADQLIRLRQHGFFVALITNQSGVGRGLMPLEALQDIHARMQQELGGQAFDAIYFCPHHPDDGCECRKPSPEMIHQACAEHGLDAKSSFVIGDSGRDIEMGKAAGCRTILCREALPNPAALKPEYVPEYMARKLTEAVDWILAEHSSCIAGVAPASVNSVSNVRPAQTPPTPPFQGGENAPRHPRRAGEKASHQPIQSGDIATRSPHQAGESATRQPLQERENPNQEREYPNRQPLSADARAKRQSPPLEKGGQGGSNAGQTPAPHSVSAVQTVHAPKQIHASETPAIQSRTAKPEE